MSEIKVTQMPEAQNINDNDLLMIVQGGYNKKIPKALLDIPTKAHQINVGEDTDYRVNLLKTKNLFDAVLEQGTFSDVGVKSASSTNYRSATMVAVKPNTIYTFSINGVSQKYAVYYYDSEGTFINAEGLTSGTFTTPANTKFINMRCFNADYISDYATLKIQLEEGSTATEYTPFIHNQINVDNEKFSDTINVGAVEDSRSRVNVLYNKNLFNKNDVLTNKYVDPATGEILTSNSRISSNYIELKANTDYVFSNATDFSTNGKGIAFYNSSKTFISGTSFSNLTNNKITTPANTSYMIFSYDNSSTQFNNIILQEGNTPIVPSIKVDNEEIYRKPKVLWENPNSGNDFASQTIQLNDSLANYDYYEIIYRRVTSGATYSSSGRGLANQRTKIDMVDNGVMFTRTVSAKDDTNKTMTFSDCSKFTTYGSSTSTTTNSAIIPVQIIGY